MDEIIKKIFEIATGKRAKIFWAIVMGAVVIFLILYPYIDANILIYSRLNQRIDILAKISELDTVKIKTNELLRQEYDSILEELVGAQDKSIVNIAINDTERDRTIKFISGGFVFWFVSFFVLFSKSKKQTLLKRIINNVASTILCIGIGCILALIGKLIPTFFSVWINAIGFPIVQVIIVALLVYGAPTNKNEG